MPLVDWLYPKKCLGCKRTGSFLCSGCIKTIKARNDWVCPECNKLSTGGRAHLGCQRKYSLDGLVSLYEYQGLARLGIKSLKYEFLKDMKEELLNLIARGLKEKLKDRQGLEWRRFLSQKPAVVPMPLYWRRQNWRGFNQAEIIGKLAAEIINLDFKADGLVRQKSTKPQVSLKKEERSRNIQWAFKAGKGLRGVKRALLIDDVWTTGATMREAGKVLKKAGAKEVWGMSLAR